MEEMDFRSLLQFKSKNHHIGILGIELLEGGLRAVNVSLSKDQRPVFVSAHFIPCSQENVCSQLSELIKKNKFKTCSITMGHGLYQLMLVDTPEVEDDELASAMKWKVAEMTNQSVESIVVDAFRLPSDAYRGRMNMAYVAIIKRDLVSDLVTAIEAAGGQLLSIGINELSMAKLFSWLPAFDDVSVALIKLDRTGGLMTLIENGNVYLCRALDEHYSGKNLDEGVLEDLENIDSLALDIQRSLDYYESQLGKDGVELGFIFVEVEFGLNITESLNERLPIPLIPFQAHELFEELKGDCQASHGPAIGAALGGFNGSYDSGS